MLLNEMVSKYDRQRIKIDDEIRDGLRRKDDRSILLQKLKQKKIVIHYMGKTRERINVIMKKRYEIEQLNLTRMQLQALRETASIFKDFNKQNNIDKIEELNDTMEELTQQVLDINETLGSEPLINIDEDELLAELESFETLPDNPIVSTIEMPMVVPHFEATPKSRQEISPKPLAVV